MTDLHIPDRLVMGHSLTIAEESLDAVWDEAQPLLLAHWAEISAYPDIPLQPDRAFYARAEAAGMLCILTARMATDLVGYAVFFIKENPHYAQSLQATQDIFYVARTARGAMIGLRLLGEADKILKAKGVQVVYQHVKLAHPGLGILLERTGYHASETLYAKRLDVET